VYLCRGLGGSPSDNSAGMKLGYRPALDGVRCFAILPVVGLHAFGWPRQGSLGVDLFFVLSGFLITTLLLQEHAEQGFVSLRRFYRRRALRLLPALFLMLGVFALVTFISLGARGRLDDEHLAAPLLGLAAALTYTANVAGAAGFHPSGLAHLWSLAQEEQFYLLWPPLLFLVVRARKELALRLVAFAIAFVVVERMAIALSADRLPLYRLYDAPDTHADPILVGCLTALAVATGRLPRVLRDPVLRPRIAAGSAIVVAAAIAFLDRAWVLLYTTPLLTLVAAAVAVVVLSAATDEAPLSRILGTPPLVFIGRISYSLYLWHVPVLAVVRGWTGLAVSLALAATSYYAVEQPFLRRKHRRPKAAGAPAPALARG
jgi:peptidoglycan/LPS O-acetylase OafA/YrhL